MEGWTSFVSTAESTYSILAHSRHRSCALIHRHRPDLLDWQTLDKTNAHAATRLAFTIAQQHLNIPQLLDVSDICDIEKPDERSVMTYVAQYFHAFSVMGESNRLIVCSQCPNFSLVEFSRPDGRPFKACHNVRRCSRSDLDKS